jgi:hypothetical protein
VLISTLVVLSMLGSTPGAAIDSDDDLALDPGNDREEIRQPYLGPVVMGPGFGDWQSFVRPLFRAGDFDLAKVHVPPGYSTNPHHVVELIRDGAEVVIFKTEDCEPYPDITWRHLVERGFFDLVDRFPEVHFVIQMGNEPEICGMHINSYVRGLIETIEELRPVLDRPNLEWMASLPIDPDAVRDVVENTVIPDLYDSVGTNMLTHFSPLDDYLTWHEILEYLLDETELDIWITEIGINHPPMDKALKAELILEFVDAQPADRIRGVAIFILGQGTYRPQYELSESMMPVFARAPHCHYYLLTDQWLCSGFKAYWEQYGGLMVFGFPITPEFRDADGHNVQYFERARFEWHPGAWPEQHDVLLGLLGVESTVDMAFSEPFQRAKPEDGCTYFPQTGHNLCGEFEDYWRAFGALPIYGFPISEAFIHPETGLLTQYFERTRFEYHPDTFPQRHDVLQGLLGKDVLAWRDAHLVPPRQ